MKNEDDNFTFITNMGIDEFNNLELLGLLCLPCFI